MVKASGQISVLASTAFGPQEVAHCDGQAVLAQFGRLFDYLGDYRGGELAGFFAIPEVRFSAARNLTLVTWYTDRGGAFRPFGELSEHERAGARQMLAERLQALADVPDPAILALLRLALNVPDENDIFFNGEDVALTRWGHLSGGEAGAALAPLLPPGFLETRAPEAAPPTTDQLDGTPSAAVAMEAQPSSPQETLRVAQPPLGAAAREAADAFREPVVVAVDERPRWWSGPLAPMLAFVIFLALFLAYILWPGNLIYPVAESLTAGQGQPAAEAGLTDEIRRLHGALRGDVCAIQDVPSGSAGEIAPSTPQTGAPPLTPPRIDTPAPRAGSAITPEQRAPAANGAPAPAAPATPRTERSGPRSGVADTPNHPNPAPADAAPQPPASPVPPGASLVQRLDQSTVFLIGNTADGVAMGSGILLGPRHVLTNFHVVEGISGQVMATNQHLAAIVPARVVARSASSDISTQDFALLELSRPVEAPAVAFSTAAERLDGVVAAGFPSFVISSDPSFIAAFRDGDAERISDLQLALTRGEITAKQAGATGTTLIAHSATISQGNSGGPLVDSCGRIVGINTFVRTDAENSLRLNYALSATDAVAFLRQNGFEPQVEPTPCAPAAAPPAPAGTAHAGTPPAARPATANGAGAPQGSGPQ